ncbi:unnamed protein product, partial [Adineta ricciae]
EIEEDRQFAVRTGATTTTTENQTDNKVMRGTAKNRVRINVNDQHFQENQLERSQRQATRRKFENARNDAQPQRAQRIDYNRLKRERAQEINNPKGNSNNNNSSNNLINPQLHQYAFPFQNQSENTNADRIGSGRFTQQQRTQEHGQRKREERMRRCTVQNNGHAGGSTNEFHLDVPPMPLWQNSPMHIQLVPANLSNHHHHHHHHTELDNLMNTHGNHGDQIDQSAYIHNFVYSPPAQASSFNGNGTVYFAQPAPPHPSTSQPATSQTHFHQYHSTHPYETTTHHQFHMPTFQSSPLFQPPLTTLPPSQDTSPIDLPPRFRHVENKFSHQRPMSGDFERLHNAHHSSSRFNNENRFQSRPQSFYDFSSSTNNFFRSSNTNRFQRTNNSNNNNLNNNNTSLPLSAYMNADDSLDENENINNNNHWGTSYQRRRSTQQQPPPPPPPQQQQPQQQRIHNQDKHQFPLSSYDPRQYGFHSNYQRRNNSNTGTHTNRRHLINNNRVNSNDLSNSNGTDLIEEWWEDDNIDLLAPNSSITNADMKQTITAAVDDSGNSSLSTSMHLKESISDDSSANDPMNPPSDISTTDSNIIESLDKLQQQLKLEEAVDERLASANNEPIKINKGQLNNEPTPYDTAHFMQWAKEKFREELAGRLTAQEIEQQDAVTTDDDEEHDGDDDKVHSASKPVESMDALEDDLNDKLTIDENQGNRNQSIVVE